MTDKVNTLKKLLETLHALKEVSRGTVGVGVTQQIDEAIFEIERLIKEEKEDTELSKKVLMVLGKLLAKLPLVLSLLSHLE